MRFLIVKDPVTDIQRSRAVEGVYEVLHKFVDTQIVSTDNLTRSVLKGDSGSQAGMTRSAHHRLDRRQESFTLSFPTPDQVEGDVEDAAYQIGGALVHPVIPDTSGIAFKVSNAIPLLRPE
jgi:hypothetical protein